MDSESKTLEERLKSFWVQLRSECAILERIVHKNKNQHRRSGYFQYLLKVRRDFRLFLSAEFEELLNSCFQVIKGDKPTLKIHLLESLKWRKCNNGKRHFIQKLLGVARLLSQATEPILKAAEEISILLAQSFFKEFSLTALALLGRLRVLSQQVLLDIVAVFNMVSSLSQKRQSVKITQGGIEVFREYYPSNQDYVTLECVWEADKFVLQERMHKHETESRVVESDKNDSLARAPVSYQSIEAILEDEEPDAMLKLAEMNKPGKECPTQIVDEETKRVENASATIEENRDAEVNLAATQAPESKTSSADDDALMASASQLKMESKRVAFVSVKRPSPSKSNTADRDVKKAKREDEKEKDPFFYLLAGGNLRDNFF